MQEIKSTALLASLRQALRYIEVVTAYKGAMTADQVEQAIKQNAQIASVSTGANSANTLASFSFTRARLAIAAAEAEQEGPTATKNAPPIHTATQEARDDLFASIINTGQRLEVADIDGALFCLANIEKSVAEIRNRITGPDQDTPGAKDVFSFLRWLREREMGASLDAYSIGGLEGLAREFYDETTPVKDLGHVAFLIAAARAAVDRMKMNGRFPEIQACLLEALAAVTGVGDPNADTFQARRNRLKLATEASYQHLANERARLHNDMELAVWNQIKDQPGNLVEHDNAIHISLVECTASPVGLCAYDTWHDEQLEKCLFCGKAVPDE